MTIIAYAFLQYRRLATAGRKKESVAHRPSQLCPPYVAPFSRSWLDRLHSDVHIAENGYAIEPSFFRRECGAGRCALSHAEVGFTRLLPLARVAEVGNIRL